MTRHPLLLIVLCLSCFAAIGQPGNEVNEAASAMFSRITEGAKNFKVDTSAAPNDKITRKIIEVRNLRGGFNINEAIQFKIEEDRQKKEMPAAQLDSLAVFFTTGNGNRWLNNAMIWIYRNHFTYTELKQLVKFYRSVAGRKMSGSFPVVMLQSLIAAENVKSMYMQSAGKK